MEPLRVMARRYLDLIAYRAWADLRAETERTYLGLVWWVLEPLLFLGVFYVVMSALQGTKGVSFVSFLLVGLVFWQWFKSGVMHAGDAVYHNVYLLRHVRIAPWVFPATTLAADTVKFGFLLLILLMLLPAFGHPPNAAWLHLPGVIAVQFVFALGLGAVLAALVPLVPDLRFTVDAGLHALMFVSGIFFPLDSVPASAREWMMLNPLAVVIDQARGILLHDRPPDYVVLVWPVVIALGLLVVGVAVLQRTRTTYAKAPQ